MSLPGWSLAGFSSTKGWPKDSPSLLVLNTPVIKNVKAMRIIYFAFAESLLGRKRMSELNAVKTASSHEAHCLKSLF